VPGRAVIGTRRLLAVGALVTVLGVALAATAPIPGTGAPTLAQEQSVAGGVLVVLGWAILALGIHRFGRTEDPR
jgi:hypothetical protein